MTAQGSVTGYDILQQEPVLTNAMWPNRRNIFDLQQDGCEIDEILSGFISTIYTSQPQPNTLPGQSDLIIIHLESSKFINSQVTAAIILK